MKISFLLLLALLSLSIQAKEDTMSINCCNENNIAMDIAIHNDINSCDSCNSCFSNVLLQVNFVIVSSQVLSPIMSNNKVDIQYISFKPEIITPPPIS
ncbi:hypothetical protein MNB_SUP05-5-892 [hydrothermal vent metagenome]|uniref:Uncharacterized protein n=1 Tax=hydrothermal vent metagenome TaxID=652676 RepID=A0A1W1CND5_9ZZZZ